MQIPILENGYLVVDGAFLSSSSPSPPEQKVIEYFGSGEAPDLHNIAERFNGLAENDQKTRFSTDGEMAKFLHESLKLSPYEASQHKFWHYLAAVQCPQYVAWRWFGTGLSPVPKNRYLGPWYKNALGRLWWWAQYTYDPFNTKDMYHRTVKCAASQELMRDTIENLLCGNRPLVSSLCDVSFPGDDSRLKDTEVRELIKRLNALLVTTVIDSLDEKEVRELVESVLKELATPRSPSDEQPVKKRRRLPRLFGR